MTIDPQFESRADKKLNELCEKNKLNAIVFGHFQEEDDLIVVFRYYLAGEKIPKKQRIFSTKSVKIKIDENINNELQMQVDALTKELEDKLIAKFAITQPENKKDDENNSDDKTKNPPVQSNGMPEENQAVSQAQTESERTPITVEEMLTPHEVYKMIMEKGFYCETVDSDYHKEALKGIRVPKDSKFNYNRQLIASLEQKEIIRTESTMLSSDKEGEKIILKWPKKVDWELCYYDDAKARLDALNKSKDNKDRKWRIPTIMELFSIIKGDTGNHFHTIFKLPKGADLIFWTSTQVKKEGTKLEYNKDEIAYFVIRSKYIEKDIYSVSFASYNINRNEDKKALLFPVFSENEYRYKPIIDQLEDSNILGLDNEKNSTDSSISNKIDSKPSATTPSIVSPITSSPPVKSADEDKIPGFDDVPSPLNNSSKSNEKGEKRYYSKKNSSSKIKIAIYPYTYSGILEDRREKDFLNLINDEIEKELNSLKLKLNFDLTIIKENSYSQNNNLTTLYNILLEKILENQVERSEILSAAKLRIMNPENIDIIVTVEHYFFRENLELLVPIIISGIDDRVYFSKLGPNPGIIVHLKDFIREKIFSTIYKKI
ncbi:MAG TPA: hypothetical protein VK186_18360 [Candidatus Deferrimicrobium sp.]|nr:hypothetical protein [Candidatus Deferrimicrobium sp.]